MKKVPQSTTKVPLDAHVSISKDIYFTEDDLQHVIIMNTETGDFYGLDDSAALIWKILVSTGSMTSAVAELVETYNISEQDANEDVQIFVATLATAGLVSIQ